MFGAAPRVAVALHPMPSTRTAPAVHGWARNRSLPSMILTVCPELYGAVSSATLQTESWATLVGAGGGGCSLAGGCSVAGG